MTVKQFFKSTAFKCIAVLLSVLLVSGILLAIAWGFLEVTDEERFNRKIGAVYGGETVTSVEQDLSGKNLSVSGATIQKLWYIEEKEDYLVQAASRGYGGDITCWIAVEMQGTTVTGIGKVLRYAVADAAELIGNIGADVYDLFSEDYTDGKIFTYGDKTSSEYIGTGASYSLTAICNCVNGAVEFVKAYASGAEITDPLEGYEYNSFIDEKKTNWTVSGEEITYTIITEANSPATPFTLTIKVDGTKKITAYSYVDGSTESYGNQMAQAAKDLTGKSLADVQGYLNNAGGELNTGATRSNELCYNAAAFALANYEKIISAAKEGN
ncbi:MAG: hypothetical protein K2I17_02160 [Clostridia bacterium]|nr:hypothetical protein [Clostridia bacterium]